MSLSALTDKSLGVLVKIQIMIGEVWVGSVTSLSHKLQEMLMLLV